MLPRLPNTRFVQAVWVPHHAMKTSVHNTVEISLSLVVIVLPITLLTAAILHKNHQIQKRQSQIALLEKLWELSPNGKLQ